ncbi:MAG: HAD-IA family hydrolase [Verrucomicrobiota bacterium]
MPPAPADRRSPIQAVTFDVGGTLIEPRPSVGHIYAEVARRHGIQAAPEVLNERFKAAWRRRPEFDYTRAGWCGIVEECFNRGPLEEKFFSELYDRFADPASWHLYDDVLPTLDALEAGGVRLGIVSNWDERLRELLDRFGLLRRFEVVMISCEAGCRKPAEAIFKRAAAAFGLEPGALLHVGDHPEFDLAGARAAGFQAWRIARRAGKTSADHTDSTDEPERPGLGEYGLSSGNGLSESVQSAKSAAAPGPEAELNSLADIITFIANTSAKTD